MNPADVKVVPVCLCSICCFLSIFAVIALPMSFRSLEQGKYALQLSWTTQQIGTEVFTEPGMYMVGLGNMFVEYPSTFQSMYFVGDNRGISELGEDADDEAEHRVIKRGPLRARSKDGLEMIVSLSFQWQLNQNALHPLYGILGGGTIEESLYRDEFVRFARAAIVESCAEFTADYFFTNRQNITTMMHSKVQQTFDQPELGLQATITGLQLREVDLPDDFDQEIMRTQEKMQEIKVAEAEREEQKVIMQRKLMETQKRVERIEQDALGKAAQTTLVNEAVVKQLLFHAEKQAEANREVLSKLWHDADPFARLFEMMEIRALNTHNDTDRKSVV